MNNNQKKLFELLIELKNICNKNKIDMYLDEKLLYCALNGGKIEGDFTEFSVTIKCDDINKLVRCLNKEKDRSVDYLLTNKNFPGFHLRYVNNNTLYFPLLKADQYKNMGFAIDINVLKNTKMKKLDKIMELGLENLNSLSVGGGLKAKFYAIFVFFLCLFGKKRFTKKMFNKVNKVKNSKKYYYKGLLSKVEKYDSKIFNNTKVVTLNGEKFNVPDDASYLSNRTLGMKEKLNVKYQDSHIMDADMPYETFFAECKKRNVKINVVDLSNIIFFVRKARIKFVRRNITRCWNIMFRTQDRFDLLEYYTPLKPEILKLYGEKKYDELKDILSLYIEKLGYYYTKKLGFVFDPVIFNIVIDILIDEGREKYANELIALVPKQHMIPMRVNGE